VQPDSRPLLDLRARPFSQVFTDSFLSLVDCWIVRGAPIITVGVLTPSIIICAPDWSFDLGKFLLLIYFLSIHVFQVLSLLLILT
jgi:hypothetical protein